jgi:hypothetical protein
MIFCAHDDSAPDKSTVHLSFYYSGLHRKSRAHKIRIHAQAQAQAPRRRSNTKDFVATTPRLREIHMYIPSLQSSPYSLSVLVKMLLVGSVKAGP